MAQHTVLRVERDLTCPINVCLGISDSSTHHSHAPTFQICHASHHIFSLEISTTSYLTLNALLAHILNSPPVLIILPATKCPTSARFALKEPEPLVATVPPNVPILFSSSASFPIPPPPPRPPPCNPLRLHRALQTSNLLVPHRPSPHPLPRHRAPFVHALHGGSGLTASQGTVPHNGRGLALPIGASPRPPRLTRSRSLLASAVSAPRFGCLQRSQPLPSTIPVTSPPATPSTPLTPRFLPSAPTPANSPHL